MQRYAFSIEAFGTYQAQDYEGALFEAGCDHALVLISNGRLLVDLEREGPSFDQAVETGRQSILQADGRVLRAMPMTSGGLQARGWT